MDDEFRKLERLAKTGDEEAQLALSRLRLRAGMPPILQAYLKQLQIAKQEVKDLEQLGSRYLLGMLEEVFIEYFRKYGRLVECVMFRYGARRLSHTGRPTDVAAASHGDRIVSWYIEGPFIQLEPKMAKILSTVMPIGQESTNFPRGPRSVSVIEALRIPGWESVIGLKKVLRGFNMSTAGVLAGKPDAPKMRAAIKELVELAPHLEGIKNQVSTFLNQIMDKTGTELLYFIILPDSFEVYSADQHQLITSLPFENHSS